MVNEPGVIRRGYHAELDELRDITKQGRQIIAAMEERERKRTGIASLKIRYNQVFGFYIEISKANLHLGARRLRAEADSGQCREIHVERAEGIRTQGAVGRRACARNRAATVWRNSRGNRARGGATAAHGGGYRSA